MLLTVGKILGSSPEFSRQSVELEPSISKAGEIAVDSLESVTLGVVGQKGVKESVSFSQISLGRV